MEKTSKIKSNHQTDPERPPIPPTCIPHLCRIKEGWEGRCNPYGCSRGYPIRAPLCCCQEGGSLTWNRSNYHKISSAGKLVAAQPALPKILRLGNEPDTSLARGQAGLQGRGTVTKASLFLLLAAASPQPWCDTYKVESPFDSKLPAAFPRCSVAAAGSGSSPPAFLQTPTQEQSRGAGSDPGRIWLLSAPPGVCINPSWSRLPSPSPCLPESQPHLPPGTPLPQRCEMGSHEEHRTHFIFSLSALFTYES